ncbi:MAG: hypothetical protein KIT16_08185 [Rhodospirillaceae bacterium]|nr:hypothetical protein [Rhodospirillaceae bacterium]
MRAVLTVVPVFATMALFAGSSAAQTADIADLCKQQRPCTLVKTTPAGTDAQGRKLTIVELNLGEKSADDPELKCRPYRREFWLRVEGRAVAQQVLDLCNDGYGASGVGEDDVTIRDNLLVHAQNGGSAWRWDVTRNIQLSPLKVLTEAHCSYHNISPGFTTTRWDWRSFSGEARWTPKRCAPARDQKEEDEAEMGCVPEKAARRYVPIPMLEGALGANSAPLAHLGSCAGAIDDSGKRGFILFGKPGTGGAVMRALMVSPRDLIVTITDDRFTLGAANWIDDDHIELWLGHGRTNLECEGDQPANLRQWGIGLDGKVHAGVGNAKSAPQIVARLERTQGSKRQVTLHLRLPDEAVDGLALVYSKSVNGKQARLVAYSPFKRSDPTTLGATWRLDPKGARCAVKDGQLDLVESGVVR